jgi:DNA-directed RNA polymerase alpha subunit
MPDSLSPSEKVCARAKRRRRCRTIMTLRRPFYDNRERLRAARLAREAVAGPVLYPALGLPDETPIFNVRFSTRITNALSGAGVKTVGEIRGASDATLLSYQDLGASSIARLRETLGPAQSDAPQPKRKEPR